LRAVRGWMDAQNGVLARLDPQVRPPIQHLVISRASLAIIMRDLRHTCILGRSNGCSSVSTAGASSGK
jgi:hypothetical protein